MKSEQLRETEEKWLASLDEEALVARGLSAAAFRELARAFLRRADLGRSWSVNAERIRDAVGDLLAFIATREPGVDLVRVRSLGEMGYGDPNGGRRNIVVETCMADRNYIVDTTRMVFDSLGYEEAQGVNLILPIRRNSSGTLLSIRGNEPGHENESITRFVVRGPDSPEAIAAFEAELARRMKLVADVASASLRLRKLARELANEYQYLAEQQVEVHDDAVEARAFLEWLLAENYRFYAATVFEKGGHNGDPDKKTPGLHETERLGPDLGWEGPSRDVGMLLGRESLHAPFVDVRKSTQSSVFHKKGKLDRVVVRRIHESGSGAGGVVFVGQFSLQGLATLGAQLPIARRKLRQILDKHEVVASSFQEKAIAKAFNTLPIEYLLELDADEIYEVVAGIDEVATSRETLVHLRIQSSRRCASAFVTLADEAFSSDLLDRIENCLRTRLRADYSEHRVATGASNTIVLHFFLTGTDATFGTISEEDLEAEIADLCTPWSARLRQVGVERYHDGDLVLYDRYADAFPESYRLTTNADTAWRDIGVIEGVLEDGRLRFAVLPNTEHGRMLLRLYHTEGIFLSDVLPVLDRFGLRVLDQDSIDVKPARSPVVKLDTFRILAPPGSPESKIAESADARERFVDAIRAAFMREVESDSLNRLVVTAGLTWQEADVLRAYLGYAMQLSSSAVLRSVLLEHANATAAISALFAARFDPALDDERPAAMEAARRRVEAELERIQNASADRTLRMLLNLVEATVRTNIHRTDRTHHYISFKIDCSKVANMPEPRPMFEIYVHDYAMEGVHLRGGRIARGGLRWSDRVDDYRTEVFGLQRAQMVKNVLIIPLGAKGGFVLKRVPEGISRRAFADQKYETFIRGLLDVTDNLVGGNVTPPPQVVRHDSDDPYLVVAADKGTAHLSDTANRIAKLYGHWLGDAFASGGSQGYDHKALGITALGAWACAREHFRGIGIDPERDVIRVVGIGDMSGDVFGNGMLLSKTMKLVGAFDHRHIFVDPDPDPLASWNERSRLFRLPGSQWSDYDQKVMSKGGGVYERTAKTIPLSPEVRTMLGYGPTDRIEPEALIKRLLTLDVDLIWNGGIGTFVKASTEDHSDANDRTSDSIRVDANQLRARVFAEGGNLGVTQKGRIEFALRGGLINTDAVDNSAGVDCSDHEVNLKILFDREVSLGRISPDERNRLIAELADQVCQMCVANNEANALMLTFDEIRSQHDPKAFIRTINFLEQRGVCSAEKEGLPTLRDLQTRGLKYGLTRPELAKLDAFVKMYLDRELLASDPTRLPGNDAILQSYFPQTVYDQYRDAISNHLLLREILSTRRVHEDLTYAGATGFVDLLLSSARPPSDVIFAYTLACHWFSVPALRAEIRDLPASVPAQARYAAIVAIEDSLRESAGWLLSFLPGEALWACIEPPRRPGASRRGRGRTIQFTNEHVAAYEALVRHIATVANLAHQRVVADAVTHKARGLPDELAYRVAMSTQWLKVMPITDLVRRTGANVDLAASTYLSAGQKTHLNNLVLRVSRQPCEDDWEARALRSLQTSMLRSLHTIVEKVLRAGWTVDEFLSAHPHLVEIAAEAKSAQPSAQGPIPVSALVVVADMLQKYLETIAPPATARADSSAE